MSFLFRGAALGAAVLAAAAMLPKQSFAAEEIEFRISLETGPNHSRNKSVEQFVELVNERSGGALKANIYHGGALFKDRDIPKALAQGTIDMALPGTWQLSSFLADADLTALPAFFGLDREDVYKIVDGEVGQELNQRMEDKLRVKVLGRWLDLGYANTYSATKKLETFDDLQGMKIRFPGGTINSERYAALGANTVLVPWPDVPMALVQRTVDGLETTNESIRSAKLWESGLKYGLLDQHVFFQYVPLVSGRFWQKLSPELQTLLVNAWEERIDGMREYAAERQDEAQKELTENGVELVQPTKEERAKVRESLLKIQDNLVKQLDMDPELARKATEAIRAGT